MKKAGNILFWVIVVLFLIGMVAGWYLYIKIIMGICAVALLGTIVYRLFGRK